MKTIKPVYTILAAAAVAAVLCNGCGSTGSAKGGILPTKLYYHGDDCVIEPGCEAAAHDNTVYPRWMFAGKWIRKDTVEASETVSVDVIRREYQYTGLPIPQGETAAADSGSTDAAAENSTLPGLTGDEPAEMSGDDGASSEFAHSYDEPVYSLQVDALPVSLKFDNDSANGESSFGVFYLEDIDYCQVTFQLKDSGDTVSMEGAFDTASDQKGNRLALGLDGLPADAPGFENDRLNLTEYDYDFSWTGCELTLSHGKDSAVYVPSMYPDGIGDLKDFENYYFFSTPGQDSYEFTYLELNGNGYGTVNAFDLAGDRGFSVEYAFDQNGKLTMERDDGLVMEFPEYWISDHGITLSWPDGKGIYVTEDSVLGFKTRQDEINNKYLYDISGLGADARVGGERIYIYQPGFITDYIEDGWQVYADLEKSMVPPGAITEPFEMRYKGGRITARAMNRYNRDLPLKDCSVCWVEFDTDSGDIGLGRKVLRCGEAGVDQFEDSFDLVLETEPEGPAAGDGQESAKGKRVMLYKSTLSYLGMGLEDEDYPAGEVIPIGSYLETWMEFQDDVLQKVIIRDPSITEAGMEKALNNNSLNTMNIVQLRKEHDTRSGLIAAVETAMEGAEARFITDPADGTVILNAYSLFVPAGTDLSEEGKIMLDEFMELYGPILAEQEEFLDSLQIIGCCGQMYQGARTLEWTQKRADAVLDYLKSGECAAVSKELRSLLEQKAAAKGIGNLDYHVYRAADLPVEPEAARIEFRFLQKPADIEQKGTREDTGEVSLLKQDAGDNTYIKADPETMRDELLQLAQDYEGSFGPDTYTNTALGLTLRLPEGWYFYNAAELTTLNGNQAAYMLASDMPFDYVRALSGNGDCLINFRFYHMNQKTGGGEEEAAGSLHASQRGQIRAFFGETTDDFDRSQLAGRDVWRSRFIFKVGNQDACKDIYYLWDEERHVLTEITIAAPDSKQTDELAKQFGPS